MSNQMSFDEIAAARDNSIDCVDRNANIEWKIKAYMTGMRIAEREEFFVSEDIWQALLDEGVHTHEPRAMGAVMRRLQREKVIAPTGKYITSASPLGHGRPSLVWQSLIWVGRDRTLENNAPKPDPVTSPTRTHTHIWVYNSIVNGSPEWCRSCGATR